MKIFLTYFVILMVMFGSWINDAAAQQVTPVRDRTPQVRDAIVAAAGVVTADQVTEAHLAAITKLNLGLKGIRTLKGGDFDGLNNLKELFLYDNLLFGLPPGIFDDLTQLTQLLLWDNRLSSLPPGIFKNMTQLESLDLDGNQLSTLPSGIFDNLTQLTWLYLNNNQLSTLPDDIFDNLTQRMALTLKANQLSTLPSGIFKNMTQLESLDLDGNQLSTLPSGIFDNLTQLESLHLRHNRLSYLPSGIFDNLTQLTWLYLNNNQLSTLSSFTFRNLTQLTWLDLDGNQLSTLPSGIFDNLTQLIWLGLNDNQLSTLPDDIFDNLTQRMELSLKDNQLSTLPSGIFKNMTQLTHLYLSGNQLSTLPDGIFAGLTELIVLRLDGNAIDPLPLPVSLEAVGNGTFKAVASTGAPFDIVLPLVVSNGSLTTDATTVTIHKGRVESEVLTINRTPGTSGTVTVNIGVLPGIPTDTSAVYNLRHHQGYALVKSGTLPLAVISGIVNPPPPTNNPPVFTEGGSTTRTIAENTAAGVDIGSAVSATDADSDTLTYTLSGTDAAAFRIVSATGQLRTQAALDYETKSVYTVAITASDGSLTDSISVTITVTDVDEGPANRAPVFTEGASTTRTIAENTVAGVDIGSAVSATDADGDTLTYTLSGTDAAAFRIVNTTGQLRTQAALDYETESIYTVAITASDGSLTDTISVTITVTDVAEGAILDVNGDGQVTVLDLVAVALFYGTQVPADTRLPADVNADNVVNILDLTAVAQGIDAVRSGIHEFSLEEVEAALLAAVEQMEDIKAIAEAPIGAGTFQHILPEGVYSNVADALADARHLPTGDARLGKGSPEVLEALLHLLSEMHAIPEMPALLPNYPNPFNPETWIPYQLSKPTAATIRIYAANGQVVRTLTLGHQPAGMYQSRSRAAYWDGRNQLGEPMASGVYFYTLTAGDFTTTRKMLIRK